MGKTALTKRGKKFTFGGISQKKKKKKKKKEYNCQVGMISINNAEENNLNHEGFNQATTNFTSISRFFDQVVLVRFPKQRGAFLPTVLKVYFWVCMLQEAQDDPLLFTIRHATSIRTGTACPLSSTTTHSPTLQPSSSQMYETNLCKILMPESKSLVLLDYFYLRWLLKTVIKVTISPD